MMRVELMTIAAGEVCGRPGAVVSVTDEQAAELIAGNYAKAVDDGPEDDANDEQKPASDKRAKRRSPQGE